MFPYLEMLVMLREIGGLMFGRTSFRRGDAYSGYFTVVYFSSPLKIHLAACLSNEGLDRIF